MKTRTTVTVRKSSLWWPLLATAWFALLLRPTACHGQLESLLLEEEAFKRAAEYASQFVVQVETFAGLDLVDGVVGSRGATSGTIVHEDGWIVCSLYPFRNQPASITVVLADGSRLSAKLVARDFSRELALLKVAPKHPLPAPTTSMKQNWKPGQWTIALGKSMRPDRASPAVGILSAMGRAWNRAIQTDAKISPLNYGGPLIDLQGRVLGIITPINVGVASESEVQQWYDSGIGFAIPLEDILARLPKLQSGADIYPGKLGIRSSGADDYSGPVKLLGVSPGSPASAAGLKRGDIIQSVRGIPVATLAQFRHAMGPIDAEQTVAIEVFRDGKTLSVECLLAKEIPVYREPYLGILPAIETVDGVRIAQVLADSPAARAGLQTNDLILQVADQAIDHAQQIYETIAFQDATANVPLLVRSGDNQRRIELKLSPWPASLDANLQKLIAPQVETEQESGPGLVRLELGDVPNKCIAYIPPNYRASVPHGLAIIFAEAGIIDEKAWTDAWGPFCRENRWILAVLGSRDKNAWSLEELELVDRVMFPMTNDYNIDRRKISIGGIGTGGFLALIAGVQNIAKVRGVWMIEPKLAGSLRFPSSEPLEHLHILGLGEKTGLSKAFSLPQKQGHHVIIEELGGGETNSGTKFLVPQLELWLRHLEVL